MELGKRDVGGVPTFVVQFRCGSSVKTFQKTFAEVFTTATPAKVKADLKAALVAHLTANEGMTQDP